jgi:hypothetical protein
VLTCEFGDDGETSLIIRYPQIVGEDLRVEIINVYLFFCEA